MDVGDVLAERYELLDEVGVGGMGRVLRAHDRTLDRVVAVKLLAPHLLGDEDAVVALRDEARRAASVRHPNVVQVLDAVLDDTDQPAIVMEFVGGPSLAAVVGDDGLAVEDAQSVLAAVGAGLQAVHAAGLVHRDVTPANVLLDDGVPRLTDFGIARAATATATRTVRGSVGYLAPEQASGDRVGPAADVYALGCLAMTLLTGAPPFTADDPVGVVHQHRTAVPPRVRDRSPTVPAPVDAAVAAALAKAPDDRPGLADLLARLAPSSTILAPAAPRTHTTIAAPTRVLPGRQHRLRPVWLALLTAAVVAAAATATVALVRRDTPPELAAVPTPLPSPSSTPSPSPSPTPSPSPSPSPSPNPSPPAPADVAADGLRDLRALLVDLRSRDELSSDALEKLDERAAAAADELRDGKPDRAARELRELRRELGDRVEKEEVSRAAEAAILDQVLVIEAALDEMQRAGG